MYTAKVVTLLAGEMAGLKVTATVLPVTFVAAVRRTSFSAPSALTVTVPPSHAAKSMSETSAPVMVKASVPSPGTSETTGATVVESSQPASTGATPAKNAPAEVMLNEVAYAA